MSEVAKSEAMVKPKKYRFRLMVGSFHEAIWRTRWRNPDGTETILPDGVCPQNHDGTYRKPSGVEVREDVGKTYRAITDPSAKLTFEERFPLVETDIDLVQRYNRPNSQKFQLASQFSNKDLDTEEGLQRAIDEMQARLREVKTRGPTRESSNALDSMSAEELRTFAAGDGIEIPRNVRTREQLLAVVRGAREASVTT